MRCNIPVQLRRGAFSKPKDGVTVLGLDCVNTANKAFYMPPVLFEGDAVHFGSSSMFDPKRVYFYASSAPQLTSSFGLTQVGGIFQACADRLQSTFCTVIVSIAIYGRFNVVLHFFDFFLRRKLLTGLFKIQ